MSDKPADSRLDHIALEERILAFWRESRAFERLRELRADAPLFRFLDGPITANNPMGVHHAWGRTLKDALLRYRAMRGQRCRYQNGFDCQGLWVEVEVEKALGLGGKPDIERFGLDNFARACRERVETFSRVISEQSIRLGQWMDWDDSYYTHTDGNITGIWHFLKECHARGWVYRGSLPMPWCPRCGTSLSEHEMAGSYQDVVHLSLFAHVPLRDDPTRRLLAWTTTPWTLPANVALAVNPDLDYVEVTAEGWDHTLVVAERAREGALGSTRVEIVRRMKGTELVDLEYETFLSELPAQQDVRHVTVPWKDVDPAEGSGIVHIAPGCGREDHELARELGLAAISPVDDAGIYVDGFAWLSGRSAMEVADDVAGDLEAHGKLLRAERHSHSFPHCWRCKGELIFRLVDEWFIASDGVRPAMIAAAREVTWQPDYMGKRMEDWLLNMGDWCISRKRYWGLPLPFYRCDACEHVTVVGSLEELRERAVDPAVVDSLPELHRPWIDDVRIACAGCGAKSARVPEVGDCWLDAGIVPFSTLGYFEDRAAWREAFPAEWICEMREQVRLWYYSMLFMGVVIEGRSPYEKVHSHERVIAEDGTRFSKTGFMIRFDDAVANVGADATRYLFCRQPVGQECRFGYGAGQIAQRRLGSLWNVLTFFTTYAEIDRPEGLGEIPTEALRRDDRWLLARTGSFADVATRAFETWDTPTLLREFEAWIEDVSNWYVRISRRRFWRAESRDDKQACYAALYAALKTATQVLAPITPFFSEEIWQSLVRRYESDAPQSVHHSSWPRPPASWRDDRLLETTSVVREAVSQVLALRMQAGIRVRQPLRTLFAVGDEAAIAALREQEVTIRAELNVREIAYPADASGLQRDMVALDFRAAGPVLRGDVARVGKALEALDEDAAAAIAARVRAGDDVRVPGIEGALEPSIFRVLQNLRPGLEAGSAAGLSLWLDTGIDEPLEREGLARDLIRRIQVARREADLGIVQRIALEIETESPKLRAAIEEHADTIREELLADSLALEIRSDDDTAKRWDIQSQPLRVSFRPVAAGG